MFVPCLQAAPPLHPRDLHQRHILVQVVHHGAGLGYQVQSGVQPLLVLQRRHRQGLPRPQPQTHRHRPGRESRGGIDPRLEAISVVLGCTVKGPECLCVTLYSLGQRSDICLCSKCHFWPDSAVFTHAGRPLPHQPAPDAHQLLPLRHGHHYVLLCSH